MLKRLLCLISGHKRGKRIGNIPGTPFMEYRCPRCGGTWKRKVAQ